MSGGLYLLTVGVLQPAVCMNVGSQLVVLHWWSTTLAINGLDDCLVRDRAIPLAQDHVTHVNKGVFSERGRLFSVGGGQWCGRPGTQVYVCFSGWLD
jgi:hypothetical protein